VEGNIIRCIKIYGSLLVLFLISGIAVSERAGLLGQQPGNLIHTGFPNDFTWSAQTFSGFYYDANDDIGMEELNLKLRDSSQRTIDPGMLEYTTEPQDKKYKYYQWGTYQMICFMGEEYFASDWGTMIPGKMQEVRMGSLLSEGELRKVLQDQEQWGILHEGEKLPLGEGYSLGLVSVRKLNSNESAVETILYRNNVEMHKDRLTVPMGGNGVTYTYEPQASDGTRRILMVQIKDPFPSVEQGLVTIDGIFQISTDPLRINEGHNDIHMEVNSVTENGIQMINDASIYLGEGRQEPFMSDFSFIVANDSKNLRFFPYRCTPHEERGTIVYPGKDLPKTFILTPYNFYGFYYDIDHDVTDESLSFDLYPDTESSRILPPKALVYRTCTKDKKFKFEKWGYYKVIGFLGKEYFAGYSNKNSPDNGNYCLFSEEKVSNLMNYAYLAQILKDESSEKGEYREGDSLHLEERYGLKINQIDRRGNRVHVILYKDGRNVTPEIILSPSRDGNKIEEQTFVYNVNLIQNDGSIKQLPIIAVHFQESFRDPGIVEIDGIWQISEKFMKVEESSTGEMGHPEIEEECILMKNPHQIRLIQGHKKAFMNPFVINVPENSPFRFYVSTI
jgi:S-layer protein (TIGR01567 family)